MLTNWASAGLGPDLFWDQTFATFNAAMLGAAKRRRDDYAHVIAGAWWGEFFAHEKKVKPLAEYLPKPPLSEDEEMAEREAGSRKVLAMFRSIAASDNNNMTIRRVKRDG
ncbi:hypothetical protein CDQ91_14440 [Sphingopyxis witflariensis]|uniref:Uncharacterized protein n=2 Tax=Sphingopyxis witflariensis TaxID=173675 RepID=A0A2D0AMZ8_9SPHN|nr:hypothetical protein CDQ91_14440 [Sphingopyxis witflariensis]